jgi:hypothetical protein
MINAQQRGARTVRFRNEDLIVDNHRTAGVDAFELRRPPRELEVDFPRRRIKHNESAPRKNKAPRRIKAPGSAGGRTANGRTFARFVPRRSRRLQLGDHGTGVTRQFIGRLPTNLTGQFVERYHAAAVTVDLPLGCINIGRPARRAAPDVRNQEIAPHNRRPADAEEVFHHAKLFRRVDLPDFLPVNHLHASQSSLGAHEVNPIPVDHGRRSRTVVVTKHVGEVGRQFVLPKFRPRFAVSTSEPMDVDVTIEMKQSPATNRRRTVAFAEVALPDNPQRLPAGHCGRDGGETRFRRTTVAPRAKKVRPVDSLRSRPQIGRQVLSGAR